MIRIYTSILLISLFISGCFSEEQKQTLKENRFNLGDVQINYYSNKSVTSLEIPPDLTSPDYENSFRLSELVKDYDENIVNLTNKEIQETSKEKIMLENSNIDVRKSGTRRWLIIDKEPEVVWNLSRQFFQEYGFVIKKANKKIGIMETDYLENKPVIPAQSLGFFKSFLAENVKNINYSLPSVDSYKIRIEPLEDGKTELHLSLKSMAEVITSSGISGSRSVDSTYWQSKERDVNLEAEMLYQLMLFLGGDVAESREKIINAKEYGKVIVNLSNGLNGFAKLIFQLDLQGTWDNLSWALTNLEVELDSKDIKEKSFYIYTARTSDMGIMSRLLGDDAVKKFFRIQLKQINENTTEVYFSDISELNEKETKEFSYEFLERIQKLF